MDLHQSGQEMGVETTQQIEQDISILNEELREYGSFNKAMRAHGRKPEVIFLEDPSVITASAVIAKHLELPIGERVLRRYRRQSADELPYRLIDSYYPVDLFGERLGTDINEQPLFAWLKDKYGLKAQRAKEKLNVRLAKDYESDLLHILPHAPVVDLERTVWADNGHIIEWAKITAVADRYTFTYKYDIVDPDTK